MQDTYGKRFLFFSCLFFLLLLLIFAEPMLDALRAGLYLCAHTVIPSLFPFMVLSSLLVHLAPPRGLPGGRLFEALFRIPGVGLFALFIGALCGFPLGARTAADLFAAGHLSKREAERLAALSNNTGPAFCVAGVGVSLFGAHFVGWLLYAVQLFSGLFIGFLLARREKRKPFDEKRGEAIAPPPLSLSESIYSASLTLLSVSGTILFFSALCALPKLFLPPTAFALFSSFLEIGNATAAAGSLPPSIGIPIAAFAISFSGLSVHLQAASVLRPRGLSVFPVFYSKLLCGILSFFLSLLLLRFL